MTDHEHVELEIVGGGPYDGRTLEVPVARPIDYLLLPPGALTYVGIPVHRHGDRLVIHWHDLTKRLPRI